MIPSVLHPGMGRAWYVLFFLGSFLIDISLSLIFRCVCTWWNSIGVSDVLDDVGCGVADNVSFVVQYVYDRLGVVETAFHIYRDAPAQKESDPAILVAV